MNQASLDAVNALSAQEREALKRLLKKKGVDFLRLPIARRPHDARELPLSQAQRRFWFLAQLEPDSPFHAIASALLLEGEVDAAALQRSLDAVVRRHEALRTRFTQEGGVPRQEVQAQVDVPIARFDVSHLPEAERDGAARAIARQEARRPFALAEGPLLRAALLRLGADRHLFVLVVHHIVSDAWSMGVLLREVAALYRELSAGRPPALPPLPIQYADFAYWQQQWMDGDALAGQLEGWARRLAGAPPLLSFPADRPRPAVQAHAGAVLRRGLGVALSEAVRDAAGRAGATPFMVLLAAFKLLLARYSGQHDVCIGTPVANRPRSETQGLVGLFVNTLVLRTDVGGNPTAAQLLERVRHTTLDAFSQQDLPFEQLVERLQPERSLGHAPLFQVMFVLHNAPAERVELPGLAMTPMPVDAGTARVDVTLSLVQEASGELVGSWEYDTELFDRQTIERLAGHYARVLRAVVERPQQPVEGIELLDSDEAQQVVHGFNATREPHDAQATLVRLLERQAERTPDVVALACGEERLTYGALHARANRLARHLRRLGIGPDCLVGLCVQRGIGMVVGALGVLKAGGAYVPMDPGYPAQRLAVMVGDAKPRVLLTQDDLQPLVQGVLQAAGQTADILSLDGQWDTHIAQESAEAVQPRASGANLAYVIYTSGSTGKPKGVGVSHASVVNFLHSMARQPGLQETDTLLAVTSLSFDIAGLELYLPLMLGARVVLAGQDATGDPKQLGELMQRHGVAVMQATPATWRMLLEAGQPIPPALKVLVGGEALPPQLAQQLVECTGCLWNLYGPTETTIWSAAKRIDRENQRITLGTPIANTRIYVLDAQLRAQPLGVAGEVYIAGAGLARGYWGRPDLTAERFLPDPHGEPGSRMYRTGDIGRWLASGELEYLGRADDQVKVRGFRIELGEIEAVLARQPGVAEAVLVARDHGEGDKRLVAYVVGKGPLDAQQLTQALAAQLPPYMVPSQIVVLDALPLTPNGKLDRKALPEPEAQASAHYVAPQTDTERDLALLWSQLLRVQQVGLHDNFFALGGHSLLATQAVARIRARFGVELELKAVFEAPSLQGLARRIKEALAGDAAPRAPIMPIPRGGELPLSFAQQRLWFLQQIEPDNPFYNMTGAVRLAGQLDEGALERALQRIVQRHEVLRTRFVSDGGQVHQVIEAERPLVVERQDFSAAADAWQRMLQQAQAEAARPFDLQRDHLLRVKLLTLGEDDHVAVVSMHHIVSDGWSMGVLIREVGALYAAYAKGEPEPLKALPIQYADYAIWQRNWLQGEELEREQTYWSEQLKGAPALLSLPTDRPRPAVQSHRGARHEVRLDAVLTQQVRALGGQSQATLFMVLNAALAVLLARYSGQDDISIGSPIANRRQAEAEPLIGLFVNTLVLRTKVDARLTVKELLRKVRDTTLGAYAHQDLPFEQLVELMKPERSLAHSPLFQVMLILQNAPRGELTLPGVVLSDVEIEAASAKFDLTLSVQEDSQQLRCGWEYNTDLFDAETIERLASHYERLLRAMVGQPQQPVGDIELLDGGERHRLLEDFNATREPHDAQATLVRLLERQAERTPDAVALACGEERLTYGALHARANRLARHLRRLGIGPDGLVGLCMRRGIGMVVGALGILKAGGAYVPMDPGYPAQRLAAMVGDARPRVVLTQDALQPFVQGVLQAAGHTAEALSLDGQWDARIAPESGEALQPQAGGANLAYVIYTSGSTGRPKGVGVSHASVVNFLHSMAKQPGLSEGDTLLAVTSLSFDIAGLELYLPLMRGARVVLAGQDAAGDPKRLGELMQRHDVTVMQATPATWRMLLDAGQPIAPTLKVLVGGEALPLQLAQQLIERTGGLWNMYGPTETTIWSAAKRIDGENQRITLGTPIANTRIYVLDEALRAQPLGVAGEVYIAGAGLARGYWNKPELTAERFQPDPHGEPGSRMYRTGDIGRWLASGELEYLGRADDQVKVRGFRIELGEIEAVLSRQEGVAEAVVVARDHGEGDKRLVAYVVGKGSLDAQALTQALAAQLPPYMVPSQVVVLDALPLTPNGKIDRKALPEPEAQASAHYVAPRTDTERELAQLWSQLLRVQQVGLRDNFFALGGHSLLATQLVAQLRSRLGVEIPLAALFEQPTLGALAARIAQQQGEAGAQALPEMRLQADPANRHEPFELNDIQQAYWLGRTGAFGLGGVATHVYREARLRNLDLPRFERALNRVIARHEMLRAVVEADGRQRILREVPAYRIDVLDLRDSSESDAQQRLLAVREEMSHQVLDTTRWPIYAVRATLLPEDVTHLHVSLDMLLMDASSIQILLGEIRQLYLEPEAELPQLEVSFRDYVIAERALQQTAWYERALGYWRERLADFPLAPQLPLVADPQAMRNPKFGRRGQRLGKSQWDALKAMARSRHITPSALLLSLFGEVLGYWSAQPRMAINLTLFRRLPVHAQIGQVVGDFTSLILLEVQAGQQPLGEAARAVQSQLWRDMDHAAVSGVRVQRELARLHGPQRAAMPVIFTSTLTNEQPPPERGQQQGDAALDAEVVWGITQTPQVWLDHQVAEVDGELVFNWDAVEALFPAGLLDDMFEAYCALLQGLAVDAALWEQPAGNLLPQAQQELQRQANATQAPVEQVLLHALFERQAASAPHRTAVIDAKASLTYGDVQRRAKALAAHLQQLGAQPNTLVGVVMDKGWEQVVASLAVLYAGAAYLPLDPGLPTQRLHHILERAQARIVLTQSWLQDRIGWPGDVQRISVDTHEAGRENLQSVHLEPTDLAYVIYTSGSTGQPKGVVIDHRGAVNTVLDINRRFGVGPEDRVLGLSALTFDLSVYDIFGLLAAGGTIVLPPPDAAREPRQWLQLMREHRVTLWNTVPALLGMLAETGEPIPDSLRLAMLSGDWIPLTLPDRARALCPGLQVVSLGGATEASIWSIWYPIDQVQPQWTSIPYGRALTNQSFHVLDAAMRPRPVWVPGPLYIGGIGLAQGYWRDAEKTSASFVVHPHTGERLYKTGDLGRWLPDGSIEFLGREDFQVKVQGYRIELGEIEAALESHPQVRAAAAHAIGPRQGDKRLVGYVVPAQGQQPDAQALTEHLAARLPGYMVPSQFVFLDALPLTPNGKVDRKALPEPEAQANKDYAAPQTELQQRLAQLWQDVLQVERVGLQDDFFALGGHSLLATQLVAQLRSRMGVDVPLAALFEQPTLGALAARIAQQQGEPGAQALPEMRLQADPASRHEPFELNDIQQAYWLGRTGAFGLGGVATHVYREARLRNLDLPRFERALNRVIARHEMLRAVVEADGRQRILREVPAYRIDVLDLRDHDEREAQEALLAVREEMSHQVLDTTRWPIYAVRATLLPEDVTHLHVSLDMLLMDASSIQILLGEIRQLYLEPEAELPQLEISFRDYVIAERALQQTAWYEQALGYWRERLADFPLAPQLPLVADPQAMRNPRFERRSSRLDRGAWDALKTHARRHQVTPSALLLSVFGEVLGYWSAQPRMAINLTLFRRLPVHAQIGQVVGDFTSLILLEVHSGQQPLGEAARAVQSQLWRDMDHAAVSGVRVQRELARMYGTQRAAMPVIFTSTLTNEAQPAQENEGDALLDGEVVWGITQTPQVWLDHQVAEVDGELVFNWDAVEALFPPGLLDDMFEAYCALLNEIAVDEKAWQRPACIALPAHQQALQCEANATAAPIEAVLLHELFERQANAAPDRIAVIDAKANLTYGDVQRRAKALAAHLQQLGAQPNTLVGVVMDKGWEQVVASLAVLYAGAAYLPLDPSLPAQRLHHILERAQARIVLTQSWLQDRTDWPEGIQCLSVDTHEPGRAAALQPVQLAPTDLAYVIYTSGSTGQPKGVVIDHRGAVNTVLDINRRFGVGPEDRVLGLSALTFDLSVYDIFGLLAAGGTLVLPAPDAAREPRQWLQLMREHGVSIWNTVPALLGMLVETGEPIPGSLRLAMLSGDWIPLTLPDRARALCPGLQVVSLGGATEASIWSIWYPIDQIQPHWTSIPYGRALTNQSFHVLDAAMRPRPVWVPGPLYIGGIGLAQGYWRDAEKTNASFVVHPQTHERLYKTGDLGRWLPDGTIEFLGREDFQVKVQGYRIELGEIEAALESHPQVRAAAAHAIGPRQGDKRLVGYVVAAPGQQPDAQALTEHLTQRLPSYMVPSQFVFLDALPLTPNGKVDRKALPEPEAQANKDYAAPQTELQQRLAQLWQDVLQVERVGLQDNFFELGGNSLTAITLAERMRAAGLALDIRTLFEQPTLAALAAAAEAAHADADVGPDEAPPNGIPAGCTAIAPQMLPLIALDAAQIDAIARRVPGGAANVQDIYPLAPLQKGLLFHHFLDPAGDTYLLSAMLACATRAQMDRFVAALQQVVRRHDILRTAILSEGLAEAVQVVLRDAPVPVIEVAIDPDAPDAAAALRAACDPRRVAIDIAHAPLIRVHAGFDARAGRWLLATVFHHLIVDHFTFEAIKHEVQLLLAGQDARLPAPLPFRNYIAQVRRKADAAEEQAFFRGLLGDFDTPLAPFGLATARADASDIASAASVLPQDLVDAMRRAARARGLSVASLCHLAWALVLARASGRDDVVFGTVLFGRMQGGEGADRALGLFVNALPVRLRLAGAATDAALRQTHTLLAQLLRHEHVALTTAQGCSGVAPTVPLFSSLLNYRHVRSLDAGAARMDGLEVLEIDERTNYPFSMSVNDSGAQIELVLLAPPATDPPGICGMMRRALQGLVEALDAQPARPLDAIDVLPVQDCARQLVEWNATARELPPLTLVQRFARQVAARPDAEALRFEGASLSYRELDARANRLARHLRARGVGMEDVVAVMAERSLEMVVALLAVLKAGGAYLPLDAANPAHRQGFICTQSGARLLLTQRRLAQQLQALQLPMVLLDADAAAWDALPAGDLALPLLPQQVACAIYTSGSTGQPKGVMVTHRNVLRLVVDNPYFDPLPGERTLQIGSLAFDASTFEIWAPLLNGGTLVVAPPQRLTLEQIGALVRAERIRMLLLTTALFNQLVDHQAQALATARHVLTGGEAMSARHAQRLLAAGGGRTQVTNGYGPAECATFACCLSVQPAHAEGLSVPIGPPIANTEAYVLDADLRPVPVGATGELHLAGLGLARGYLGRPDLTAERFIPNPFGAPGSRMYKTGDLARWRPDGLVEYLGRVDQQVKLRGFRIELGEVENALMALPEVGEAAVLARGEGADRRLVAYVVPRRQTAQAEDGGAQEPGRAGWNDIFDALYGSAEGRHADGKFNIFGWNSSYDRTPIPAAQMREWVDETIAAIQAGGGRRVLEIGCGSGLLLHRLAPACERYWGTDLSAVAIRNLDEARCRQEYPGCEMRLLQRAADDWSGLPEGAFDTVVINSVAQYFPDTAYLERVIEQAARRIGPAGRIFVGDVRNFGLLRTFHSAIALYQAADDAPLAQLRRATAQGVRGETELLVHPDWFHGLQGKSPRIRAVRAQPKYGAALNELTRFRYDVVIEVGDPAPDDAREGAWRGWDTFEGGLAALEHCLASEAPDALAVSHVTNSRVWHDVSADQLLHAPDGEQDKADLAATLAREAPPPAASPDALRALARRHGYLLELGLAGAQDAFHAVLRKADAPAPALPPWRALCDMSDRPLSNPVAAGRGGQALAQAVQAGLRERLPDYMVPGQVVVLDAMPLTANGKTDRRALPEPEAAGAREGHVPPRTETEAAVAALWQQVLKSGPVGVHDDFFALGGHSLRAIELFQALRRAFGASLPLSTIFSAPTVAALAAIVDVGRQGGSLLVPLNAPAPGCPLYLLHPVGGQVFFYQKLAQALDGQVHAVGVQAPEVAGLDHAFGSLDALAAAYASAIREAQPQGPYRLAGWSSGALFALAVARALEEQRCAVEYVGVLDAQVLPDDAQSSDEQRLQRALLTTVAAMRGAPLDAARLEALRADMRRQRLDIAALLAPHNAPAALRLLRGLVGDELGDDVLAHLRPQVQATQRHWALLAGQVPRAVSARVQVVQARGTHLARDFDFTQLQHGGAGAAPAAPLVLDGDHYAILQPPRVARLAQAIRSALRDAPGEQQPRPHSKEDA